MNLEADPAANTVLVLTEPGDATADLVVKELEHRGARVFRVDTGDFPLSLRVSAWFDGSWRGEIHGPDGSVDLRDIRAVYVRRPTAFTFPPSMTDAEQRFAGREARRGIGGLLMSLPCSWLNHPSREADAEYKPFQLVTAAACGLDVPRTVITNVPDDATKHNAHLGSSAVYKTFASATIPDGQQVNSSTPTRSPPRTWPTPASRSPRTSSSSACRRSGTCGRLWSASACSRRTFSSTAKAL